MAPDELDAALALYLESFGPTATTATGAWLDVLAEACAAGTAYAVRRRPGELIAIARVAALQQWWNGHPVPVAGIADVAVAPHQRGAGVAQLLLTEVLADLGDEFGAAVLYPSAPRLYARLGWGTAGVQRLAAVQLADLRAFAATPGCGRRRAPRHPGRRRCDHRPAGRHPRPRPHERPAPVERHRAGTLARRPRTARLRRAGRRRRVPVGVGCPGVEAAAARTPTALAAVARPLGSHAAVCTEAQVFLAPQDPLALVAPMRTLRDRLWWLRLLDVRRALTSRGYPTGVEVAVELTVDDPQRPADSGTWRLEVSGADAATASRVPDTSAPVRLTCGGASALRRHIAGHAAVRRCGRGRLRTGRPHPRGPLHRPAGLVRADVRRMVDHRAAVLDLAGITGFALACWTRDHRLIADGLLIDASDAERVEFVRRRLEPDQTCRTWIARAWTVPAMRGVEQWSVSVAGVLLGAPRRVRDDPRQTTAPVPTIG